jgi:hypothetical protein
MHIGLATDRHAFNKLMMSPTWKRPVEPNLLYDRMFNFYDTDNNGLIGLKEYVLGIAYLRRPDKQSSLGRIFLGYDLDGDGYVSRSDFVRMLSAKYAVQKKLVEDSIRAAEFDMVTYTANVVRSSQPISAAFAQEDVPPGHTRLPTMKVEDRFGENQIRPDAGPFASAVLPDGLELPDSSLLSAIAHRYGVDALSDNVVRSEALSVEQLTALTSSLNGSDVLPVDSVEHGEEPRFMVDTDLRQVRRQTSPDGPEQRWHQDLLDATGRTIRATEETQETRSEDEDLIPPLPADILERGRAYEVPAAEKDFGSEVIFQVVQEGLNELIDPIFAKSERLAEKVRITREERRRFRKEIDEYVQEEKARREELVAGSAVDPLMAIANAANSPEQYGPAQRHDPTARMDTLLHVESTDASSRLPTPREIAIDLQDHIVQQSQTLDTDIENLEANIREQSLDDLLAQSGYIVDFANDTGLAPTHQHDGTSPDTDEPPPGTLDDMFSDMPALEEIPVNENLARATSPLFLLDQSPSLQHLQAPFSTPDMDSSASEFAPFRSEKAQAEQQFDSPSREKLSELAHLDEVERNMLFRGGPGRLNLAEFEEIIRSDRRGILQGVAESWLEWAEF